MASYLGGLLLRLLGVYWSIFRPPRKGLDTGRELQGEVSGQRYTSITSYGGVKPNADGSYDIYFGPKPPLGKGCNVILRFYGPLCGWFDHSWRPGEIELLN
ncbi:MAG: hypothetical protein KQH53_05075 [Desulfarculaceae bacterium]|nr:hypothetical protein [Desulfarculaceae bacterium]